MKKQYTSPNLTVVSIKVEQGYASSTIDQLRLSKEVGSVGGDHQLGENRSNSSEHWTSDNENGFWDNSY